MKTEKMSDYRVDESFTRLLLEEPLWARISRHIDKVPTMSIPTAGVRVTEDGRFEMMYNPNWFENLQSNFSNRDQDDRFNILKHELFHIILGHIFDERLGGLPHRLKNIAYDLAINSHIHGLFSFHERYVISPVTGKSYRKGTEPKGEPVLPNELCVPSVGHYKDYPVELSAEEYAELLKKDMCEKCGQPKDKKEDKQKSKGDKDKQNGKDKSKDKKKCEKQDKQESGQGDSEEKDESQQNGDKSDGSEGQESEQEGQGHGCSNCSSCGKPQNGQGQGQGSGVVDEHNWDNASEEARQIARERMREVLREATNEINSNNLGWGSTPAFIKEKIIKFVNGTVDWKKVLAYFVQSSIKADRKNSIKKINKRFPYIHAGRTHNRTANIAISIDQSGSVGDDMLEAFFGELNNLSTLVTFTVIPFDCDVDEKLIEVWKKGQKQAAKRVMSGGTNFNAPTKYVNDAGIFDAHIILTDMQAPKPIPSKVPRMWMTTEEMAKHVPFATTERIIPITRKGK
jgi:predicted metal-dependent peptidase